MDANVYRIEKVRRRVVLVLAHGERLEGDVFVQMRSRSGSGPEEPLDLLNDDDLFFPLSVTERDVVLVAKDHLMWAESELPALDLAPEVPHLPVSVRITLADGSSVSGDVLLPEATARRSRLVDFLNAYAKRFLALHGPDRLCLVNRRWIAQTRPLS